MSTTSDAARWLPHGVVDPARPRLFCFPHAGAGASAFATWRHHGAPGVDVCPVQPPGRAERFGEPAHTTLDGLLDDLVSALRPQFRGRFALYGHSVGALVAFGLARRLRSTGASGPVHLFVSGRAAPQLPDTRRALRHLSATDIVPELRAIGGTPEEVLAEPRLVEMFLPLLQADLAVNETYVHEPQPPLDVPLTAFGGTHDPRASVPETRAWREQTAAAFSARILPGGHFFVDDHAPALAATTTAELQPALYV